MDTTYLLTFVAGTAVGAAGQYLADRFTDQRRRQERKRDIEREFVEARKRSAKLLDEMIEDIRGDTEGFKHEFVLLRSRSTNYNAEKDRFGYYESEHRSLEDQILLLKRGSLVVLVREPTANFPPVYAMTSEFIKLLRSAA